RTKPDGTHQGVFFVRNQSRIVAQVTTTTGAEASPLPSLEHLHGDVVGSPEVLTGDDGKVAERRSYAAFGVSRDPENWQSSPSSSMSSVHVGFTNAESDGEGDIEDREYGLINMNGRMYDPEIGRFISADPFVDQFSSQGLNAYAYVRNNPLKYIDP